MPLAAPVIAPAGYPGAGAVVAMAPAALCPTVTQDGGRVITTSRDVAAFFGKEHKHVLRDIKALEIGPDLGTSFFRETTAPDAYGRAQPIVEMTRDGFTLLAMGFTGADALKFKLAYIAEFNRMEAALRAPPAVDLSDPAFLRGALLAYTETVIELESRVAVSEPKALALDLSDPVFRNLIPVFRAHARGYQPIPEAPLKPQAVFA